MLNTNLNMTDIGSGLCLVENAIEIDQNFLCHKKPKK